jgi:hypothetical protein
MQITIIKVSLEVSYFSFLIYLVLQIDWKFSDKIRARIKNSLAIDRPTRGSSSLTPQTREPIASHSRHSLRARESMLSESSLIFFCKQSIHLTNQREGLKRSRQWKNWLGLLSTGRVSGSVEHRMRWGGKRVRRARMKKSYCHGGNHHKQHKLR